jgi:hypothetical protein
MDSEGVLDAAAVRADVMTANGKTIALKLFFFDRKSEFISRARTTRHKHVRVQYVYSIQYSYVQRAKTIALATRSRASDRDLTASFLFTRSSSRSLR